MYRFAVSSESAVRAHVIDGEAFAAELREDVEQEFRSLTSLGIRPGLATVLVGDDYAAAAYERRVRRLAEELGCHYTSEPLGLARGATVISCHHHTSAAGRLAEHTLAADIVIVAAGVPGLVDGEMVKEGVIAIDVGINAVEDAATGKTHLVGDLDFESVAAKAEAVSPVPGGVGPITDLWLLRNAIDAARYRARL